MGVYAHGSTRAAITVGDLSVEFSQGGSAAPHRVLDGIELSIDEGEFVSLIGPSGCGKTTLINVIAGYVGYARGHVAIYGRAVEGIQSETVAYMFARDTLLPWRTAIGNVELALKLRRVKGPALASDAGSLLDTVGLGPFAHYYPSQLSQGMRQRVALARTLAADRPILLMDEPFAALDAQTRLVLGAEFTRIWEGGRRTVVLVTHDLGEAIALADRVLVMGASPGRIIADHPINLPRPRDVLELPSLPAYHALHATLWHQLKGGITAPPVEPEAAS